MSNKHESKRSPKAILRKKKLRVAVFNDRIIDPVSTVEGDKLLRELFDLTRERVEYL